MVAQLQYMGGSNRSEVVYVGREMLQNTPHGSLIEAMEAGSFPSRFPTLNLMVRVWDTTKILLGYRGFRVCPPLGELQKM